MPNALMDDPHGAARFLADCSIVGPCKETRARLIRSFVGADAYYRRKQIIEDVA